MIIVNLLQPGHGVSTANAKIDTVQSFATQGKSFDITKFLLDLVPENFVGAFAKGDLIPILIIAILFGAALTRLGEHGKPIEELLEKISHVFFGIIGIVMYVAPLGALGRHGLYHRHRRRRRAGQPGRADGLRLSDHGRLRRSSAWD